MEKYLNRRQWLKTSAIAFAGLVTGPGFATSGKCLSLAGESSETKDLIRLQSNESHFGISHAAREAILGSIDQCGLYPDDHYPELKEIIAGRENLSPENIILGAGSIEIITALLHLYKTRGEILSGEPTYYDFVDYVGKANCLLRQVPLNGQFEHDLQAMERQVGQNISLIYICNPNNPTGSITPEDKLRSFCQKVSGRALVVVDEAYHDYVEDPSYASAVELVRKGENILVTRTFSKIFGLAGLRVGYGMARPSIIKDLQQMERNFAPVSYLSLKAAIASCGDKTFIGSVRQHNREAKSFLYKELKRLGYNYIPSHANFVLFKVSRNSKEMVKEFKSRSILVRAFEFRDAHWIRVSTSTRREMQAFIACLAEIGL